MRRGDRSGVGCPTDTTESFRGEAAEERQLLFFLFQEGKRSTTSRVNPLMVSISSTGLSSFTFTYVQNLNIAKISLKKYRYKMFMASQGAFQDVLILKSIVKVQWKQFSPL